MPALPPGSLIVVVGITGYIACYAGLEALRAGFRIRGTVRDTQRAAALRVAYEKFGVDASPENLELVTFDDLGSEAQLEVAFADADGVINLTMPEFDSEDDYVSRMIDGMMLPLRVAARVPSIKRYVMTSTLAAADPQLVGGAPTAEPITEHAWNDEAVQLYNTLRAAGEKNQWVEYCAGKTLGEKAAWEFIEKNKPTWDLVTIFPACTWGPVMFGPARTTAQILAGLLEGDPTLCYMRPYTYVDVRDCGKLHAIAIAEESFGGKRTIAAAGPTNIKEVVDKLKKSFPSAKLPGGPSLEVPASKWNIDNAVATRALDNEWISVEDAVVETAKSVGY
ncbi:NADP-binding protein [Dacryopinax primogenitus]|uniref:NADP-binding protein n=1 Tax=Dacryopinax primogenitus (strain DJM 731) TaxID=1858805 RepID=M5FN17_DACPD|nr:NADP-binding protein [Dacryopinax primogenitus]EJT96665.1 NADP-binding protein [Dacryopinax primogenitus]